jgi:hypothetical protein
MWVLVSFGSDGGADAKAEECSDQSVAAVASLPPHSSISQPAGISDVGRNERCGSTLGKLCKCLGIFRATCDVFVLGICTARNQDLLRSQTIVLEFARPRFAPKRTATR